MSRKVINVVTGGNGKKINYFVYDSLPEEIKGTMVQFSILYKGYNAFTEGLVINTLGTEDIESEGFKPIALAVCFQLGITDNGQVYTIENLIKTFGPEYYDLIMSSPQITEEEFYSIPK